MENTLNKLLELYRLRRSFEVPTLDGHIVPAHNRMKHRRVTDELDILCGQIGAKAKTALRKAGLYKRGKL